MSTTDQQHRTDMDVTAADRPVQAKGLVGFVAATTTAPTRRRRALAPVDRLPFSTPSHPGREPGRARGGGEGRRELIHRAHQLPR